MLTVGDVRYADLVRLVAAYRIALILLDDDAPITGSYWGEPEAGVVGRQVFVRRDTPLHSMLHETCHLVCMPGHRRAHVSSDAGGDDLEEAAVCYLQVVLADRIRGVGRARIMQDMDAWGYSFRCGDTRGWFETDADDARDWLIGHGLLTPGGDAVAALRR